MAAGTSGLGGGLPGGSRSAAGCGRGTCMGPWEVPAIGAEEWEVGVLVQGGIGAGCFPLDMGRVGSKLACIVVWVCLGSIRVCTAGLACQLDAWSFWMATVMVISVLSNNSSTWAVSSSTGLSGISEVLVPWIWTVRLLRYTQQYQFIENLTSFP